jgi:hypothetical protein
LYLATQARGQLAWARDALCGTWKNQIKLKKRATLEDWLIEDPQTFFIILATNIEIAAVMWTPNTLQALAIIVLTELNDLCVFHRVEFISISHSRGIIICIIMLIDVIMLIPIILGDEYKLICIILGIIIRILMTRWNYSMIVVEPTIIIV